MYIAIIFLILLVLLFIKFKKLQKINKELEKKNKDVQVEISVVLDEYAKYKDQTEPLRKYEPIKDINDELERIKLEIESQLNESKEEVSLLKKEANAKVKEIKLNAEKILEEANKQSIQINEEAHIKAEEIAGEAWAAKQNADQFEQTVKAMKNIIKGYGDEYLIPNRSLLDDLAEEYSHKDAGDQLLLVRNRIKLMITNGEAADCDYAEINRKKIAIEFVLDAFNGKVDSIMSKVKSDNYGKLLQSLQDAFRVVNHNGQAFRNARITEHYLNVILEQLKLAVTVQEIKKKDQEEQREIREAIREEEKARREIEKAVKESEKEEKMLAKAMKEAEARLSQAADEERAKFEQELEDIKQQLQIAEEKGQRTISMAQQTRRGHVYIISNVGSFGENVYKIGQTRRLDPMDRVKELGDASVPFSFDVHAMIFSDDAPKLEKELHDTFNLNRLNKVNFRKEFFSIPISEIKSKVDSIGSLEIHWTMKAEAQQYRESVELAKRKVVENN